MILENLIQIILFCYSFCAIEQIRYYTANLKIGRQRSEVLIRHFSLAASSIVNIYQNKMSVH